MSRWFLEERCRSVTYFLSIAPILFLESNTFFWGGGVEFQPQLFSFNKYVNSALSLLSRQMLKYLSVSPCRIWFSLSVTVGRFFFKVKVT
jgi:hypothetical protein